MNRIIPQVSSSNLIYLIGTYIRTCSEKVVCSSSTKEHPGFFPSIPKSPHRKNTAFKSFTGVNICHLRHDKSHLPSAEYCSYQVCEKLAIHLVAFCGVLEGTNVKYSLTLYEIVMRMMTSPKTFLNYNFCDGDNCHLKTVWRLLPPVFCSSEVECIRSNVRKCPGEEEGGGETSFMKGWGCSSEILN